MLPGLSSSTQRYQRQTGRLLSTCKSKHIISNNQNLYKFGSLSQKIQTAKPSFVSTNECKFDSVCG